MESYFFIYTSDSRAVISGKKSLRDQGEKPDRPPALQASESAKRLRKGTLGRQHPAIDSAV